MDEPKKHYHIEQKNTRLIRGSRIGKLYYGDRRKKKRRLLLGVRVAIDWNQA